MENKAMIVTYQDLNYSGEVIGKSFVEDGILIKPSPKSNVLVWIGKDEIKNVIFADGSVLERCEIETIFEKICSIKQMYN